MSAFVFLFVTDCAKYQLHRRKNSRCVGLAMDFWKSEALSIIDVKKLLYIGLLLFKHDFIFIAKLNLFVRSGIKLMFEPLSLFAVICNLTLQFFQITYCRNSIKFLKKALPPLLFRSEFYFCCCKQE